LRRHLTDQPLVGVPNRSYIERWHKWRRRRPNSIRIGAMLAVVSATIVILVTGVRLQIRDRVEQAELALRIGHTQLQNARQNAIAVQTLERGVALADTLPFQRDLKRQLREALTQARQIHLAQQLHELADEIRSRYGTDTIALGRLRDLASQCRAFWDRRAIIVNTLDCAPGSELASDLMDLAIFMAEIQVRLCDDPASSEARSVAVQLLGEAEEIFGPSVVLEYERSVYGQPLDRNRASGEVNCPLSTPVARTAWEHTALGRAHLDSGDLRRAAEELAAALECDPAGCWTNFYYGVCAYRMRRYDDAIAAFSVCIGAAPNVAGCFYNRALAFAAAGETDSAMRDYDHALAIDPGHALAALNRAMLHYERKQFDQSISDLRLALEHGADPATVYYNRALVHMAVGDPSAIEDARRAVDFNPANESARTLVKALQRVP
jgi:eukaryotic-like serine/threonine-protein kinase